MLPIEIVTDDFDEVVFHFVFNSNNWLLFMGENNKSTLVKVFDFNAKKFHDMIQWPELNSNTKNFCKILYIARWKSRGVQL